MTSNLWQLLLLDSFDTHKLQHLSAMLFSYMPSEMSTSRFKNWHKTYKHYKWKSQTINAVLTSIMKNMWFSCRFYNDTNVHANSWFYNQTVNIQIADFATLHHSAEVLGYQMHSDKQEKYNTLHFHVWSLEDRTNNKNDWAATK